MKLTRVVVITFCLGFLLSGCNTVSGLGADIKAAGGAIKDTADDTKDKMKKE